MNNKANKTSFQKGHKLNIGNKYRLGISPVNKGKKGLQSAWNKGTKGIMKANKTSFRKGLIPINKGTGKGKIEDLQRKRLEYKLWRKSCFLRDNFTDQITGERGGRLVVHHINNFADFPELRTALENGITLSEKTHKAFHHIYGYKNNTMEQLLTFKKNYNE